MRNRHRTWGRGQGRKQYRLNITSFMLVMHHVVLAGLEDDQQTYKSNDVEIKVALLVFIEVSVLIPIPHTWWFISLPILGECRGQYTGVTFQESLNITDHAFFTFRGKACVSNPR